MSVKKGQKIRLCISITEEDRARLTRLSKESCRTVSGYLRWILHQHFEALDQAPPDSRPSP